MSSRSDVDSLVGYRITVGLSQIIGITVIAGQNAVTFYRYSGGSLLVGGATLTWANGYIVDTGEHINVNSSGTFYLAAVGSTVTVMMLRARTDGFS